MITIGYIELNSIAKGVEAADTVLKAADTELLLAKPCCPGKFQILFSGEVAAVKASRPWTRPAARRSRSWWTAP